MSDFIPFEGMTEDACRSALRRMGLKVRKRSEHKVDLFTILDGRAPVSVPMRLHELSCWIEFTEHEVWT